MRTSSTTSALSLMLCALLLQACGGGGSTTPSPTSPPTSSARCSHTFSAATASLTFARAGSLGLRPPSVAGEKFVPDKLAVRFVGTQISPQAAAALARLGARRVSEMNPQGAVTYAIPSGSDPQQDAGALRGLPGVIAAGPVVLRHLLVTPNDTLFSNVNQWDMYAIGMPAAWGITEGITSVRIAIIDTGYDTFNPDLTGKVDLSIVYDQGNGTPHNGASIEDVDGHGSDVSGIAAADTNNAVDVAGTAWNVHLLEARVFPDTKNSEASSIDIAAAIDWAVAHGAKVINLSLGSGSPDNTYEEPAVAAAIAAGVVVVAASGNDARNTVDYPAADPGVLAVGASAYCDSVQNTPGSGFEYVASYSNYGAQLSVVAPGGDPDATQTGCTTQACIDFLQWIENLDSTKGPFTEQVGLFAGTSQATPHVAGAVALMFSIDASLTPAQALSIIKASADNISDSHQGSGRLDVFNALQQTP